MNNFTFSTEECIEMRKTVIKFYCNIAGCGITIPNVVDAEKPWEDVVSDFQMLIYLYLLMEGNREVERAADEKYDNGTPVIRKQAKQLLSTYRKEYNRIRAFMPMNDCNFCSQYADIDESMNERISALVSQTYYPILNNSLKECKNLPTPVARAEAHLITGMCFIVMACERGMIHNHHVPSTVLRDLGDRVCRLSAETSLVNNVGVDYDTAKLQDSVETCLKVVVNMAQTTFNDIIEHAMSLDLEPYVAAADYTKERFNVLYGKMKAAEKRAAIKQITRKRV